jgi:hypothetical protein
VAKKSKKPNANSSSKRKPRAAKRKTPSDILKRKIFSAKLTKHALSDFCLCKCMPRPISDDLTKLAKKTFKYQMVYGNYPGFAFKDYSNAQTVSLIRAAMANLGSVSGAKFIESNSSPHIRFYFMKTVTYNAIGVYMGNGKIYLSQTRPVTPTVIKCAIQHEVGHYLNVKASPPADKWGHCGDVKCVMNINGTAKVWCSKCKAILVAKYGVA